MKNGFIKVAAARPAVCVADCKANLEEMKTIFAKAQKENVRVLVYPELCITGYTCADLFFSDVLLTSAREALIDFAKYTKDTDIVSIISLPLVVNDKIYNSLVFCQNGQILGAVPKTYVPNFGEFSEGRYFAEPDGSTVEITIGEYTVPFGTKLIFASREMANLRIAAEIGTDLYAPIAPSAHHTLAGATLIVNPTASVDCVGRAEYARMLVLTQSGKGLCAYVLANCGAGESTTDAVFGGASIIAECGKALAESADAKLISAIVDVDKLAYERRRMSYGNTAGDYKVVSFSMPLTDTELTKDAASRPFVPKCKAERDERCEHILSIQARGLAQRIKKAYANKCIIGISGGLDSTLTVIVAAEALDLLGRDHSDIVGITMPCFGTTKRTRSNAEILCAELGTEFKEVVIGASVKQHFLDIGHDENNRNVVYENAQARERTQVLMDIANAENGLVVGTGDLSELALGWATYNGDHMSMYGVNADVPKTLVRHVVDWYAEKMASIGKTTLAKVLRDILDTPVSPELLPANENGEIAQKTEDIVGPYEIHDFYLYYMLRYGYAPDKLYRLARAAFAGEYSDETLKRWLENFVRRFFAQQFKRSCLPDGPKVGSVSLSPRGDWRMPSDACRDEWMRIVNSLK